MLHRIKQFFSALNPKILIDDDFYISTHLNAEQQKLFFAMSKADQFHCLHTAYTIERLVIEDKKNIDREFLIRCALLHDCGRVNGDLPVFAKVFTVLVSEIVPKFADYLELHGNNWIYIYRHHAEIGARKLQAVGLFKEAKIVAKHHSPSEQNEPKELKLLRIADEVN